MSPLAAQLSFLQLFFITLVTTRSEKRLRHLVLVIVAAVAFSSLHCLREWQKAGFSSGYRPGFISGDPNYFSLTALMGLPLAFALLVGKERFKKWERVFLLGGLGATLLALVAAASRGALIGLGILIVLAAWRSRYRVKMFTGVALVFLPLLLLSPSSPINRMLNPTHGDQKSTGNRLSTWAAAVKMCMDYPLLGVGMGNFKNSVRAYGGQEEEDATVGEFIAHNTYLQIASEAGIPCLTLFVLIQLGTIRTARQVQRMMSDARPSIIYDTAFGIELGMVAFMVTAFFLSAEHTKLFWLTAFLAMALPSLAVRARRRAEEHQALEPIPGVRTVTAA
jgi:putative inorganic carbon (hco3(-)) transporter